MLTLEESTALIIANKLLYTRCRFENLRCGFLSYFYAPTKFDMGDIIILLHDCRDSHPQTNYLLSV